MFLSSKNVCYKNIISDDLKVNKSGPKLLQLGAPGFYSVFMYIGLGGLTVNGLRFL